MICWGGKVIMGKPFVMTAGCADGRRKQDSGINKQASGLATGCLFQLVKKHACGGFFDDFCTVCLGAYGSPGGNR